MLRAWMFKNKSSMIQLQWLKSSGPAGSSLELHQLAFETQLAPKLLEYIARVDFCKNMWPTSSDSVKKASEFSDI